MKYAKDFSKGIGFGTVGAKAYELTKVWKLGFHLFTSSDGNLIFRICFLRTKKRTHYFQAFVRYKREYCVADIRGDTE